MVVSLWKQLKNIAHLRRNASVSRATPRTKIIVKACGKWPAPGVNSPRRPSGSKPRTSFRPMIPRRLFRRPALIETTPAPFARAKPACVRQRSSAQFRGIAAHSDDTVRFLFPPCERPPLTPKRGEASDVPSSTDQWRPKVCSSASSRPARTSEPMRTDVYQKICPDAWSKAVEKDYASPIWMTFKQALSLYSAVRKNERGSLVLPCNHLRAEGLRM